MEEQLISFKTAVLAKKKGFKELVHCYYLENKSFFESKCIITYPLDCDYEVDYEEMYDQFNDNFKVDLNGNKSLGSNNPKYKESYSAPTQSLLQKWLREEHNISICIDDFWINDKVRYDVSVQDLGSQDENPSDVYESYEKALEAGLQEALKLIK